MPAKYYLTQSDCLPALPRSIVTKAAAPMAPNAESRLQTYAPPGPTLQKTPTSPKAAAVRLQNIAPVTPECESMTTCNGVRKRCAASPTESCSSIPTMSAGAKAHVAKAPIMACHHCPRGQACADYALTNRERFGSWCRSSEKTTTNSPVNEPASVGANRTRRPHSENEPARGARMNVDAPC